MPEDQPASDQSMEQPTDALSGAEATPAAEPAVEAASAEPVAAAPAAPAAEADALTGAEGFDKPAATAATAPPAEDTIDYSALALAEGSPLSEAALGSMREFARDNKMPVEEAQRFLQYQEQIKSAYNAEFERSAQENLAKAKADPELGGEHWPATQRAMVATLQHFDPAVTQYLRSTKLINDPLIVAGLVKIDKLRREPSKAPPGGNDKHFSSGSQDKIARLQDKYPASWREMAAAENIGDIPRPSTT